VPKRSDGLGIEDEFVGSSQLNHHLADVSPSAQADESIHRVVDSFATVSLFFSLLK
jgi:hypothetical protein